MRLFHKRKASVKPKPKVVKPKPKSLLPEDDYDPDQPDDNPADYPLETFGPPKFTGEEPKPTPLPPIMPVSKDMLSTRALRALKRLEILNPSMNLAKGKYSPKVDQHIYGVKGGAETPNDWMEVALAALDQAGLSPNETVKIKTMIETAIDRMPWSKP